MRQEDSDLYRSEMNCCQPAEAEKILTIKKVDDMIQIEKKSDKIGSENRE